MFPNGTINKEGIRTFLSNFFSRLLTCFTFTAFLRMTGLMYTSSSSSLRYVCATHKRNPWVKCSSDERVRKHVLPCAAVWRRGPLPCTAGRAPPRCRSRRSSACACGRNRPVSHAHSFLLPLHVTFSAHRGWTFHTWTAGAETANRSARFKAHGHSPWPWPRTAGTCTSAWFCLGLQTFSCLCKSHSEYSPPSFCRAHTPRTSLRTFSPGNRQTRSLVLLL